MFARCPEPNCRGRLIGIKGLADEPIIFCGGGHDHHVNAWHTDLDSDGLVAKAWVDLGADAAQACVVGDSAKALVGSIIGRMAAVHG